MKDSKNNIYVDLFKRLYLDEKLMIDWRSESVGLRSSIDIKNEISKLGEDFTEEEFVETVFTILNTAKEMVLGNEIPEVDEYIKEIAEELFVSDKEKREYIIIRLTSKLNVFEGINYEILTKRNTKRIKEIIGYSTLITILTRDIDSDKKSLNKLTMEVSKLEIQKIIEVLQNILNDIDNIR